MEKMINKLGRFMKKRVSLLVALIVVASLEAKYEEFDVSQPIRIQELMPTRNQVSFIGIEPAIPKNFVAMSPSGKLDYWNECVFWGPKEVLEAYLNNKDVGPSEPILMLGFSPSMKQKRPEVFEDRDIGKTTIVGNWGQYPYLINSAKLVGQKINTLHVGLNDDKTGAVLCFTLVTPNKLEDEVSLKFWKNFIENTKELPPPLLYKVLGQELHPGYTIVDVAGRKIKAIAERKKSSRRIQFIIIPEDSSIEFKFDQAFQMFMEVDWHFGEPVVKIEGAYCIDNNWIVYQMTTTVLIKEVEEFSPIPLIRKNIFLKMI
jgi:hypothetical protein